MKKYIWFIIYFVVASLYALWSWILTAPNLVLSTRPFYWQLQTYLWENFYADRPFVTTAYICLVFLLCVSWWGVYHFFLRHKTNFRQFRHLFLITILPFLFSYNALSYDVFNYLFNAKMVIHYHANPHVQTATDFPDDDWTRFMHNVHTPAPYGYGWTVISLVPYLLGLGKFLPTWVLFRLLNVALALLLFHLLGQLQRRQSGQIDSARLALFFFNPLFFLEIFANSHNDLMMMVPAFLALSLLWPSEKKLNRWRLLGAGVAYIFSLSIKYATLTLAPLILILLVVNDQPRGLQKQLQKLCHIRTKLLWRHWRTLFFDGACLVMFLPLLTSRAQLFHPWYLVWSLTFVPLASQRLTRHSLLLLSFCALIRYVPYLWENGYATHTLICQQMISLLPFFVYLLFNACQWALKRQVKKL